MSIYIVNMALCVLLAALAQHFRFRDPRPPLAAAASQTGLLARHRPLIWFMIPAAVLMTLVSGLRFFVGEDYVTYCVIYGDIAREGLFSPYGRTVEIGFALLCRLLGVFFTQPFAMFFITATFTNFMMVYAMGDLSNHYALSVFLYFTTNLYYNYMNILRQGMAMSLLFWGSRFLFTKRFWPFCLTVVLAALFHQSALLLLPAWWLVHRRAWSLPLWGVGCAALVFLLVYPTAMGFIMTHMGGKYETYADAMLQSANGANAIRLLVAVLPVLVAFVFRRRLRALCPGVDILVNLSYLGALLMMLSVRQVFFARLAVYFLMYNLLLLPHFLGLFQDRKLNLAVGGALVACYMAYNIILLPIDGKALAYHHILSAPVHWDVRDMYNVLPEPVGGG